MKRCKKTILVGSVIVLFVALIVFEILKAKIFISENVYSIVTRTVGGLACMILVVLFLSPKVLSLRTNFRTFATFLPCMAVAVNNFPFITFLSGRAYVDTSAKHVALYALVCLSVGFFEEMAFRGCIFTAIL